MGEQIIAQVRQGPIRAAIQVRGAALKLFSTRQANTIVRVAGEDGGNYFVRVFIPLRFTNYARKLGYSPSTGYQRQKQAAGYGDTPWVRTGAWRTAATGGARADVTAKRLGCLIKIRVPYTHRHPVTPTTSAQFRSVLPEEMERIARQVGNSLDALLAERTETTNRKGVTRASLPTTSRAALPPKPSRTLTTTRRAA